MYAYLSPILNSFGLYEVQGTNALGTKGLKYLCFYAQSACNSLIGLIANEHFDEEDLERERVYFGHYPAGSSFKNWVFMNQIVDTESFTDFDYKNTEKNL